MSEINYTATTKYKALTLLTTGLSRVDTSEEEKDGGPRASLYEKTINTDMMYEDFLQKAPVWRRWIYKFIPVVAAEVVEAYCIRRRYDIIISWSDPHALLMALLLKLTFTRFPHVALMFWISKPKKAALLKKVHTHIDTIILWTSTHRKFAINTLGISSEKIKFIPYYVDQIFWRPIPGETDMICSVGVEMRDYPTLLNAMHGIDIRCHIAAGVARGKMFNTVKAIYDSGPVPNNITVGRLEPIELRNLYVRSRFVVIPLLPSESDNGLTVILEAMAMGKAIICSRTQGQVDVIQDGITGIFVPPQDPEALRQAILSLWNNPKLAKRMGEAGRKYIEANNTFEQFVNHINQTAEEVLRRKKIKTI
jgi:glycosyltransferase involved in cell wall biosynthesis